MRKTLIIAAALAAIGTTTASAGSVMVLGIGNMNCGKALRLDWTGVGITAWIQGYMTAQEGWVSNAGHKEVDFLPGEGALRVAGLVMKQCKANQEESINDASATIAARLITRNNNEALE